MLQLVFICLLSSSHGLRLKDNTHEIFEPAEEKSIMNFLIDWSTSELDIQVNPTTCLGDTDRWIQQVTAPTLVVTSWIQQSVCILHSSRTGGASPPCTSRG